MDRFSSSSGRCTEWPASSPSSAQTTLSPPAPPLTFPPSHLRFLPPFIPPCIHSRHPPSLLTSKPRPRGAWHPARPRPSCITRTLSCSTTFLHTAALSPPCTRRIPSHAPSPTHCSRRRRPSPASRSRTASWTGFADSAYINITPFLNS